MEFSPNRSYFRTQNKSQEIQQNQNNPLHIRPQKNKTRSQTTKETSENIQTHGD
jgi:hypothetical protein